VAITQIAFVLFSKGEREIILGQFLQDDFNTPVLDIALMLRGIFLVFISQLHTGQTGIIP
jgi:hypothetical protein